MENIAAAYLFKKFTHFIFTPFFRQNIHKGIKHCHLALYWSALSGD